MPNKALKKEMLDVVAAWPTLPTFDLYKIANDNKHRPIATFDLEMKIATRDVTLWLEQIMELTDTARRLLAEADNDDARSLITIITPLRESIDTALQNLLSSLDPDSERYFWVDARDALGDISKSDPAKDLEFRGREIILGWLHACQQCKDHLMRVIWDHDPDARGGPKFDNADDLIAFLET